MSSVNESQSYQDEGAQEIGVEEAIAQLQGKINELEQDQHNQLLLNKQRDQLMHDQITAQSNEIKSQKDEIQKQKEENSTKKTLIAILCVICVVTIVLSIIALFVAVKAKSTAEEAKEIVEKLDNQTISSKMNANGELEFKIVNSDGSTTQGKITTGRNGYDVKVEGTENGVKITGKDAAGNDVSKVIENGKDGKDGKNIQIEDGDKSVKIKYEGEDKVIAEINKVKFDVKEKNNELLEITYLNNDGKEVTKTINTGCIKMEESQDKKYITLSGVLNDGNSWSTTIEKGQNSVIQQYNKDKTSRILAGIAFAVAGVETGYLAYKGFKGFRKWYKSRQQPEINSMRSYIKNGEPKLNKSSTKIDNNNSKNF